MGKVLIGISSWTEPTLVKSGRFYPDWANTAEARLRFYAGQFPIVEVDSSYYGLPSEATSGLWVERTPDEFIFDIKAFRLFTNHPTQLSAIPRDVRDALPSGFRGKGRFYYRDLPEEIRDEMWRRFESALLPLDSAGKLGIVLFQFPPWFYPGNEQRDHILECRRHLPQYRIAIEFRHGSWVSEKNIDRTMSFLEDNDLPYVCVDEPQGLKSSVPPVVRATSDIGMVRFHGRNTAEWEKPGETAASRFNYLYSEEELKEWVPRLKEMSAQTREMHVLFNNCYSDKSVVNALQTTMMMLD